MIEQPHHESNHNKHQWLIPLLLSLAWLAAFPAMAAEDATQYSKANRLLFMTNHLDNIETPATLEYRFTRSGHADDAFEDSVRIKVTEGDDSTGKHVETYFFTGDRSRYTPDVDNATGNPVIMMFLQNEVSSIAERTGGNWRYFQKRIKLALQDATEVDTGTAVYNGEKVAVKRIRLQPFINEDTHRDALGAEIDKRYVFTLSEAVPGEVLEMKSVIPPSDAQQGEIVERLRLQDVSHGTEEASHATDAS